MHFYYSFSLKTIKGLGESSHLCYLSTTQFRKNVYFNFKMYFMIFFFLKHILKIYFIFILWLRNIFTFHRGSKIVKKFFTVVLVNSCIILNIILKVIMR